jgi:hypothetical protein
MNFPNVWSNTGSCSRHGSTPPCVPIWPYSTPRQPFSVLKRLCNHLLVTVSFIHAIIIKRIRTPIQIWCAKPSAYSSPETPKVPPCESARREDLPESIPRRSSKKTASYLPKGTRNTFASSCNILRTAAFKDFVSLFSMKIVNPELMLSKTRHI